MVYPGGKNGPGTAQRIINLMPPHATYIEGFLGSGAVMRAKRPAIANIGVDRDAAALSYFSSLSSGIDIPGLSLVHGCALDALAAHGRPDALFYLDPPYVHSTRTHKAMYAHEMTDEDHSRFLAACRCSPSMIMISGYRCALYDEALAGWNSIDYPTQTRGGPRIETLWFNFQEPTRLHDYRYLGADFRERERIKRKSTRWARKLASMDRLERQALLMVLNDLDL